MVGGYNDLSQPTSWIYSGAARRVFSYHPDHRLLSDELKTAGGASIAKITYGWDGNGNLTGKTTTGFTGAATNTYGYDWADRLTSFDDGSTPRCTATTKSGNRVQAGSKLFSYNERNQLATMSGPASVVYSYTPRGTLSATSVLGASTLVTQADGYGQVASQQYQGGGSAQAYSYDGLGRSVLTGHTYTGLDNTLAADTTATYVRGPSGGPLAVTAGGSSRLVWTDKHTDVMAQFTATGTGLAASVTYEPLGSASAGSGMLGSLGFQGEWTDTATGRVNMHARWYNPATGAFDTRDSLDVPASPASVAANKYTYADASPLVNTDPSGHCSGWNCIGAGASWVANKGQQAISAGTSAVAAGANWVADQIQLLKSAVGSGWDEVKDLAREKREQFRHGFNSVTAAVKDKIDQTRRYVGEKTAPLRKAIKNWWTRPNRPARRWSRRTYGC